MFTYLLNNNLSAYDKRNSKNCCYRWKKTCENDVMQVDEDGVESPSPIILHSSQTDDRRQHGMLDLLLLSTDSEVTTEISRQDLESVRCLELDLRQARINVRMSGYYKKRFVVTPAMLGFIT